MPDHRFSSPRSSLNHTGFQRITLQRSSAELLVLSPMLSRVPALTDFTELLTLTLVTTLSMLILFKTIFSVIPGGPIDRFTRGSGSAGLSRRIDCFSLLDSSALRNGATAIQLS